MLTLSGGEGVHQSSFVHSWQSAWSRARHKKRHTDPPKKSFQLNSDFLDLFAQRSLGCGRNFSGGKSRVRTSPIRHLLLRSCVCTCSSGMMPTTAPSTLLRAVLPTGPALTSLFADTLQIGWENVGRGDGGQLAKDAT